MGEVHRDLGDLRGKRVLVRSDLNVPLDGTTITDDGRIRASVPDHQGPVRGGRTRHRVRPPRAAQGAPEDKYSLAPVVGRLSELLGRPVAFATDTVGESAARPSPRWGTATSPAREPPVQRGGDRKDDEERAEFADALAALADAYVSDGFGVVHRKQASVYDVATRLPSAMGGLVATEVDVLKRLTVDPSARMPSCSVARRSPTSSPSSTTS
jgi:phosphoglycerate kinase